MNEHQGFFESILKETEKAYLASEIKSRNLYYSISATPINKNSTLILGFNWGAGQNQPYTAQFEMETKPFTQIPDLGSLKRTVSYFRSYLTSRNPDEFVQSNFCFFRSKKESDLSTSDLKLTQPLFDSFIEYAMPKEVVSFSARLKEYFENQNMLSSMETIPISSGTKKFTSTKAKLNIKNRIVPIYFLPHPNYPITNEARHKAWKHCFGD